MYVYMCIYARQGVIQGGKQGTRQAKDKRLIIIPIRQKPAQKPILSPLRRYAKDDSFYAKKRIDKPAITRRNLGFFTILKKFCPIAKKYVIISV